MDRWRDLTEATISPPLAVTTSPSPEALRPQTPPPWCRQKREAGAGGAMPVCCNPIAPPCPVWLWQLPHMQSSSLEYPSLPVSLHLPVSLDLLSAGGDRGEEIKCNFSVDEVFSCLLLLLFYKCLVTFQSQSFEWKGSIVQLLHCMTMN